ncbi:MAG: bifunctional demethylmenaquinone methyltransferase/2-methoxy-6-polyprenyl-1,4-benzoquinol methylase UbiE [Desulfobacteraceae bacterium]|nr:bifunctional demethylmenaquinone methyltransferase/2-methoxy-6-polyprenyl-1,4-benzoquinol methylase UbiE [Desulfobacteraceae bacterium]MBC2755116.1 bifunctional demethylmenaquinone methyltransferase/2-methoxy-6-polyprenyl-1,4-benzoquinol methylase UbiE [Desulfobacteraceae bacterium]
MELDFIKEMFDSIAPRYDFLNRLLSLRQDVYWRRTMISALDLPDNATVLDVACGTGDVLIEILNQTGNQKLVVGADFAPEMLKQAKIKLLRENFSPDIQLIAGNALYLPFAPDTFDAVTIAFGIRNIMDRKSALSNFFNCLKSGGKLAVLELATPGSKFFLSLYLFYFSRILPLIGAFFSKHMKAYDYLPASVINFPPPDKFAAIMKQAEFTKIKWRRLTMGIATVHIGHKE